MKISYFHKKTAAAPKILGFLILLCFVFALGWHVGVSRAGRNGRNYVLEEQVSSAQDNEKANMDLFWDVWGMLAAKYVDPQALDYQNMVYGAIRGMVFSLEDPYTVFMTPKENKEFQDGLEGTLEGIGAELTLRHGLVTVVSPLKDSPAQRAGLRPEDIIMEVDGESTDKYAFEQVVMKIRGPKGTKVTLTVIRKGIEEPIDITIKRNVINVKSVEWEMKKEDIAVIEINQFGNNTKDEFNTAINQILPKRPKGIVMDLRFNGGGYLDGAIDLASEFIEKGKIVSVKRRNPEQDEVIYVNGRARVVNIPLVILINKGSASASEIVAGAIRDHGRGTIIGEQSFGKGTVQEVENLIDGSSLRITIARWYTPNGVNISEVGIEPDIIIKRTPEDFDENLDPQMDAAIEFLTTSS